MKNDFYLQEFIMAYKEIIELALSETISANEISQFNTTNNLFENYSILDLSFLKGHAIIIP